jgi:hypothetical protein
MGRAFGVVHRTRNSEISGESHGAIRVQATNFAKAAKFAPVPELQGRTETWKLLERIAERAALSERPQPGNVGVADTNVCAPRAILKS